MCIYVYIYIYTYREIERERERHTYIYYSWCLQDSPLSPDLRESPDSEPEHLRFRPAVGRVANRSLPV